MNHKPLQYCIQSQDEEIQPKVKAGADQRAGGIDPGILVILIAQRLSSVGIVERLVTTKISAGVLQRTRK